ncbi:MULTISPECIES: TetR/AcrR family transcriptional regulator [Hungatella]|uniref:TetR family transcriptional regulator n=1 Tax=Hungatella hathewayi TaxID=154046 RepID=A0AAW9WLX8_9FIRM|nr:MULTISPECIES: TetR/AcrR family transcriptional regulator [Hungatella]MCQ4829455.1 TetR/AcrR family transcriptional regulator [Hungatella sp. SL.1.14]MUB65393.1 TetR family transcriptional regulator [Hungatella hathewayi]CUP60678.1 HTH-type transcriptional repressor Bm3R1 [Hungatella hathewayi]
MRITEETMQKRRELIIYNAFQMFSERGIEKVKIIEIARKSEVSDNTVYRYFENKENLVREAFIMLWSNIMDGVEKNVENTPNYSELSGFEQIKSWIEGFRHLYMFDKAFVLFSYEAKLYLLRHKVKLDKYQQDILMRSIRGPCLAALEKGKRDGSVPALADSEDLFYAIWGTIRGFVAKIVIYDGLYGEDSPWEKHYQTVEDGVLSALSNGWTISGDLQKSV